MKFFNRNDSYSPNHVIAAFILCFSLAALLSARTLWIPASRIVNLHLRAIVLSVCDAVASVSSVVHIDSLQPSVRSFFLDLTGLSEHLSWDSRYYNKRAERTVTVIEEQSPVVPPPPLIEEIQAVGETPLAEEAPQEIHPVRQNVLTQTTGTTKSINDPSSRSSIYSSSNPLEIFFFGDSQVFSLGSGLTRLVGKGGPVKVDYLAVHSSGFIRSDYFDWPSKLLDTFKDRHYASCAVMMGMNDYQSFRDETGTILKKHTPSWENAYRERCRSIIDLALSEVVHVYWIGMPRVKNRVYDESLRYIDSVQASVAEEYSPNLVTRISLSDSIPGSGKEYSQTIVLDGGQMIRVMSDDGSHFTVEGGQLAMRGLFDNLVQDFSFAELPVANLPQ